MNAAEVMQPQRIPLGNFLRNAAACGSAVTWAEPYKLDYERAWRECQDPQWMIWILQRTDCPPSVHVAIACAIAREALIPARESLALFESFRPDDKRPREALDKSLEAI